MSIDLNTLSDLHGELLPDLNKNPMYEHEDEIAHLQKDHLYEDEAHLQGQPLHLHHNERLGLRVIDLNVADFEGEQEHHKGDFFLLIASRCSNWSRGGASTGCMSPL